MACTIFMVAKHTVSTTITTSGPSSLVYEFVAFLSCNFSADVAGKLVRPNRCHLIDEVNCGDGDRQ